MRTDRIPSLIGYLIAVLLVVACAMGILVGASFLGERATAVYGWAIVALGAFGVIRGFGTAGRFLDEYAAKAPDEEKIAFASTMVKSSPEQAAWMLEEAGEIGPGKTPGR